ncbi:ATP citrate lyase citrate-binding domain-containing protein [Methylobacterium sp. CB376]|uniref:ATP-grasp domain-containing protein n=1 Tax=unclassified Methylobacterium TaxID=2615210 RepID=UPI000152D7E1|nr:MULTISPECIES: ATP-grasp domain-containing protein [Methylobacterium]WFT79582.1 ATP citrate lyase citrate-binding domain-containing protein [Methylobacterium nodulans]
MAKANGVTFEGAVPAEHEVYFSISDSTRYRAPTMTLTHRGGVDIEELDKSEVAQVPFDPLTGLKAFVVANALSELNAPKALISPLVQQLPKLWELYHGFGMTTVELNPIRMRPDRSGRLTPVACDFKCGFDRDDPRWQRLGLPGKSNNTDIFETFRAMADALREHVGRHGPTPLYIVAGRGGPNLVRGMGALRDTAEALGLPYRLFGFDSDMSEVVAYARKADQWMRQGGREAVARAIGLGEPLRHAAE